MFCGRFRTLQIAEVPIYKNLIVTVLPLFYYITVHQYSFNYLAEINGHYFSLLLALLLALLSLTQKHNAGILDYLITLLVLTTLLCYQDILNNEHLTIMLSVFMLAAVQIRSITENYKYIFGVGTIMALIELGYAIWTANFVDLKFDGSFSNSGVLSLYLVVSLPLLYYFIQIFISSENVRYIILSLVIGSISSICFLNLSRISIIILLFILMAIFYQSYLREKLKKKIKNLLLFLLLLCTSFLLNYLFYIKQNSALDRMLRTEIIVNNMMNSTSRTSILFGHGVSSLSQNYSSWQIAYFTNNPDPSNNYFLIAGESFLAFNEYLELIYDIGIIGFIIFIILNFFVLTYRNILYSDILFYVKLVVISILLAATTTYVFHINALLYVYVLCCTYVLSLRFKKHLSLVIRVNPKISLFNILLTTFSVLLIGYEYLKIRKWNKGLLDISLTEKGYTEKLGLIYEDLNYNSKFLLHYGSLLIQSDSLSEIAHGVRLLEENKEMLYSEKTLISLINGHSSLNNQSQSIKYAQDLVHLIPSKFNHRFRLIKLYDLYDLREECINEINFTLNMPIKVPSEEVTLIKKNLQQIKARLESD